MMFLQPENFQLGPNGTMACPGGTVLVTDDIECDHSSIVLGKEFIRCSACSYPTRVKGCFVDGNRMYLSNKEDPDGYTAENFVAVCKRK